MDEGDEVNLAVGQGDLQATPLQMAVAYSTLANGNHRVRPHLGAAVEDVRRAPAAAHRARRRSQHVTIDPAARQTILDGLHDATIHGTSADVWKGWNQDRYPVFGKTGTAAAR